MVMLVGVVLPTQAGGTFGGHVWLGITTVRVLRKVSEPPPLTSYSHP